MQPLLESPEILDTPEVNAPGLEDTKAEFLSQLNRAICSATGLAQLNMPPREPIIGQWFKQGDLGFIYGARGLGKTWLAMHMARQIAQGGQVGEWKVHKPRRLLYVDGEMALDAIRERDAALAITAGDPPGVDTRGVVTVQGASGDAALDFLRRRFHVGAVNWLRGMGLVVEILPRRKGQSRAVIRRRLAPIEQFRFAFQNGL